MLAVLSQNLALVLSGAPTAAQMPPAGAQTAEATAAAAAALQKPVEPLSANLFDIQVGGCGWLWARCRHEVGVVLTARMRQVAHS
jgi:hypothetical protein